MALQLEVVIFTKKIWTHSVFFVITIIGGGCTSTKDDFTKAPCVNPPEQSVNLRKIFKPCREFIYRARYWDKNYNLISDEKIWMMATGKAWAYNESQDEIAISYSPDETQIESIKAKTINPEFDQPWREGEVTGIIENENEVWMHPFRSNQYIFTEVAAFPLVRLPLEKGTQWTSNLNIYEGWGGWSDTSLSNTYFVLGQESIDPGTGPLNTWHLQAITSAPFGNSTHDYWFNEDYGFVKMTVKNYAGQLLTLELVEVTE